MYECRCDERLKPKSEESTCLVYNGLPGELEHLKIESRLIDDKFVCYESIKREIKRRLIYEYRCDERLKTKKEESIRLECETSI